MLQNANQGIGRNQTRARVGGAIAVLGLLALAQTAAARGLLAAPTPKANAESCSACLRASDLGACHTVALDLANGHDYARAIAIEEKIQERLPMNADVAASLARMYQLGTKNTARAIALYHAALHASSGYPPALFGLGTIMQEKGEMDIAARYYSRAVSERPNEPLFKVRLAEVFVQSGRDAEARPLLQDVVARWPRSDEAESARKLMSRTALARP